MNQNATNELQIFQYKNNEIRTTEQDGEIWFVLKDVCELFGETNYRRVASRLDDDEKGVSQIATHGGKQNMIIINESGLYSALFAMQPEKARGVDNEYIETRKKQLKQFKRWVTSEVIPSIRKHGAYMTDDTIEQILSDPDTIIRLATDLKAEREKRKELEAANSELTADNQIMKPKADYFDKMVDRNLLTNFRETAKQINVPPKKFVNFLLEKKYVYRDNRGKLQPYEKHVESGLFSLKECLNEKNGWEGTQTLITPKGREMFRLLFIAA